MKYLSEADFQRMEQVLNVTLPLHYKAFHLSQQELILQIRLASNEPEEQCLNIATDADWLIEMNQFYRLPKEEGPVRGKFFIGADGGGGGFFIRLDDHTDEVVYTIPHDEYEHEEIFDETLDDFIWSHEGLTAGVDLKAFAHNTLQLYSEVFDDDGTTTTPSPSSSEEGN